MPFTIAVRRLPAYTRYDVSGSASLKNYFDLIEQAATETVAGKVKRAMVDLRGVIGRLNFTDQFFIGDVVGQKLPHIERLATLVADDPSSYNSPKVATRKGVNLCTFDDEDKAIAWLLDGSS
jgi:hypothetical protein